MHDPRTTALRASFSLALLASCPQPYVAPAFGMAYIVIIHKERSLYQLEWLSLFVSVLLSFFIPDLVLFIFALIGLSCLEYSSKFKMRLPEPDPENPYVEPQEPAMTTCDILPFQCF